jgi:hypothetical protein
MLIKIKTYMFFLGDRNYAKKTKYVQVLKNPKITRFHGGKNSRQNLPKISNEGDSFG